jgi:hypothetical protein
MGLKSYNEVSGSFETPLPVKKKHCGALGLFTCTWYVHLLMTPYRKFQHLPLLDAKLFLVAKLIDNS